MKSQIPSVLQLSKPLVLASQSPRRRLLLEQLGLPFSVIPADIDELSLPLDMIPSEYVKALASSKAQAVAEKLGNESAIVLGADTIVVIDGNILNKPLHPEEAYSMLRSLSGRTHYVYTGISIMQVPLMKTITSYQMTEVTFRILEDDEIYAYIATGSPMDKAGAYGIQEDFGAVFVQKIVGCYYNIVGLPLEMIYGILRSFQN
jgi:septum formation protein